MLRIACCFIALLTAVHPCQAGFIVTAGNLTLAPGGTGSVDITVRSSGGTLPLAFFGLEVRFERLSALDSFSLPRELGLVSPLGDSHFADPGYVFAGNSTNATFGVPSGVVTTTNWTGDTYLGGDGTFDGGDVPIGTAGSLLLRLDVTSATASSPGDGDVFAVRVVPSANTFLYDQTFSPTDFETEDGVVRISGRALAVPSPPTAVLALVGGMGLFLGFRVRRPALESLLGSTKDGREGRA